MYTIIDIETTGNGIKGNKITEIAIFKFDGERIIEEYTSLVNPECEIPYFITGLTGIDNAMVRDAPTLDEIASKILEITKDSIFVAHSVNFDYNVIKNELKTLGIDFIRKKLCTVRLSRKLFPGYHSYSLGKLCAALNIPLKDRHRARGDAQATVLLFQKLLQVEGAATVFKTFLNARSQETTLPPSLPKVIYDKLPEKPGIYYFKDEKGRIIYIGKAKNIKKRVLSHFYDKATKEISLCNETAHIDYELSGNELLALLMESTAIKHHYPKFNRAQKKTAQAYGIFSYEDRRGIKHIAFNKVKAIPNALVTMYNQADCRSYLEELCIAFALCPKYCHLQENVASCSHFRINDCKGICRDTETITSYNSRVVEALEAMETKEENYLIKEKGRDALEDAFIWIQNGMYCGYGFIDKQTTIGSFADIEPFRTAQKDTLDTQRILRSYMLKNPEKLVPLKGAIPNFQTPDTLSMFSF